jgi:putative MATE family efflux protein
MRDLTKDSIEIHILLLATPVAVNMITSMAYQLVDLYFITGLGAHATAGVSAAGNVMFAVGALTQVLAVGATALIAQAIGRKDRAQANSVFNQALVLGTVAGILTMVLLYAASELYVSAVAADEASAEVGTQFVYWLAPGLGMMLLNTALASALRSMGMIRACMLIPVFTIGLNALLAPILIAGWGTGIALGARGAGLATTLAATLELVLLIGYCRSSKRYLSIQYVMLRPQFEHWRRMIRIGLPAGAELALTFVCTAGIYYVISDFGPSTQAGFGIGSRVLLVILMPGVAISFAVTPIAAQNFGAGNAVRVRETFYKAALICSGIMILTTIIVQQQAEALVNLFDSDVAAAAVAAHFLQLMSWTFVAQGLVYVCTYMFEGLGNTVPSLVSSASRFLLFFVCILWLSTRAQFDPQDVWYLLAISVVVQAPLALWLLRVEFRRSLPAGVVVNKPVST